MENRSDKDGVHVPIKVCQFIKGTDLLVTSDLEGYLKFWCVPHKMAPHPYKNQLVCKVRDENPGELRLEHSVDPPPQYLPIRAMTYNENEKVLFTGDEMGFLIKWDISSLIHKIE